MKWYRFQKHICTVHFRLSFCLDQQHVCLPCCAYNTTILSLWEDRVPSPVHAFLEGMKALNPERQSPATGTVTTGRVTRRIELTKKKKTSRWEKGHRKESVDTKIRVLAPVLLAALCNPYVWLWRIYLAPFDFDSLPLPNHAQATNLQL